ncbi:aminotransferase class I/II-fold pyridoxal phosphate-dependent enzyme [Microlunatus panaciterrae]|uniref:DNA-binding transcriptional MocR family regulator n=1 Tax=Microlunatus panaciterrae TaxID=400768 RepID=A0ABS2RKH8_9ACTN|nr:aminotransferase class I/II-fold pyridoxal phosphate-dependent enzyme [Microlunatus panaciterrae]MBM7799509.1 DNA-binding transcriptional MocR family regulator [Microlunatus panaciterrae]
MSLSDLSREQLADLQSQQRAAYDELVGKGLKLDLTRGKPSPAQLDLSNALLALPGEETTTDAAGTDVRNYGGTQGLPEIREIFSPLLKVPVEQLVAGDNASLAIMHDTIVYALLKGTIDSERPWGGGPVKFLCPTPGYDRHFALCEQFGIEMIPVDLGPDGPDLEAVTRLVADDADIKGIWIVPTYANPTGAVYSEEVTRTLVTMPTAAPDFRMFWDNAYAVHHLTDEETPAIDVLALAAEAGYPNRVFVFASTSKITFAGSGVSFFGSSRANVDWYLKHLSKRTIGPDKVNHLRHARYLKSPDGVRELMRKHREIISPKFALVESILSERLGDLEAASWTHPHGGYFISLDVMEGTATRVVELAKQAGIVMTGAGSAFPYGRDPQDRNIRIAPTFPAPAEVSAAIDGLATCVLLAATEKLLAC